ncbi:MAG: signal peptide peptidase SppA [Gammaproteobacteria bacterium]|nr:signal peptide peptidase SppA [Gammaproteobacteria bacterium]
MKQQRNILVRLFSFLWSVINNTRKLILNLIFFGIIVAIIISSKQQQQTPQIEDAALLINIQGNIVEQKKPDNPIEQISNEAAGAPQQASETLLSDILFAINNATDDDDIKMLVIDSSSMSHGSLSKLQLIGQAITNFKQSNKPVYAIGGSYNQAQYYLASYADKILMNSKGMVSIDGFSRYRLYHKTLLEKLKINTHVFRVGTYKSALEPYLRDNMSAAAKTANTDWLGDLWQSYVTDVSEQRGITPAEFDLNIDDLLASLKAANGDFATLAKDRNLVDVLASDFAIIEAITEIVGPSKNKMSFNKVSLQDYVALNNSSNPFGPKANIAVIVAKGTILNGHQPSGTIGGASTSLLLRKARLDDSIKAVVLRIDSGGGSAYASEQIRQEVIALQAAGKPVVASLGSVAASGGYWIAASADKIIAQPTTITGSIGIFGMMNTFEDTLAEIGVYTDGVATKELAGITITRDLPEGFKKLMQTYIEHGYQEFLTLVSTSRGMTISEVDNIAQGRVWSGAKAFEFGLIDQLGNFELAIEQAAELAKLDNYSAKVFEKQLTPMQMFFKKMMGEVVTTLGIEAPAASPISKILAQINSQLSIFTEFDDPKHTYLYCIECVQ